MKENTENPENIESAGMPRKPKPSRWVRVLRRLIFVVAALATLVALFYAEEDWRGARAWADCKRWLEARGESLDRASVIPPPIPDEQNFAMIPVLRAMVDAEDKAILSPRRTGPAEPSAVRLIDVSPGAPFPEKKAEKGKDRFSLEDWQQHFRDGKGTYPLPATPQEPAKDVLDAVNKYAPELDELERAAAERPLSRFPVRYDTALPYDPRFGHVTVVLSCVKTLCLRARAASALGDTERSRRDLLLSLRLCDAVADEPLMISVMVRETGLELVGRAVREGMGARRWSADDLAALSQALGRVDLLRSFQRTLRGERLLFTNAMLDNMKPRSVRRNLSQQVPGARNFVWGWPEGWFDQNKAAIDVYWQTYVIESIDPKARRIDFERIRAGELSLSKLNPWSLYTVFLRATSPIYGNLTRKVGEAQMFVEQARVACALERYYIDKGEYPAASDALVPAYLERVPTSLADGKPMDYQRTPDGRYKLSVVLWQDRNSQGISSPNVMDWDYQPKGKQ